MLSAMSFVGFCAWWGTRLAAPRREPGAAAHRPLATTAVLVAAFGTVFDFSGEGVLILPLVEHTASLIAAKFISAERAFTLLSAGAANLLYTIAGILLTLATPNLPKWVRTLMWITWLAGIGMTVAAIFDNVAGLVVSSIMLFPLMFVWIAWIGARWRGL
jgi:hypothetical protein